MSFYVVFYLVIHIWSDWTTINENIIRYYIILTYYTFILHRSTLSVRGVMGVRCKVDPRTEGIRPTMYNDHRPITCISIQMKRNELTKIISN